MKTEAEKGWKNEVADRGGAKLLLQGVDTKTPTVGALVRRVREKEKRKGKKRQKRQRAKQEKTRREKTDKAARQTGSGADDSASAAGTTKRDVRSVGGPAGL